MQVKLRAFAAIRDSLGFGEKHVELPDGARVEALLQHLHTLHPAAGLPERHFSIAVNRSFVPRDHVLNDGDEVALIPPVSGG